VQDDATESGLLHTTHTRNAVFVLARSDLPINTYHTYSDATMETLLDSLEVLLDGEANPEYEVEYSVRPILVTYVLTSCSTYGCVL
jgi:hypothetical protein